MFEVVSVMVMLFLGRGRGQVKNFSGRLSFFGRGLNCFEGVEMFSEVFSGGVGIISVVLSLFRGIERFLEGGEIFSG